LYVRKFIYFIKAIGGGEINAHFSCFGRFGSYHHYPVGPSLTVQGRSRSTFQYRHGFNIIGVNISRPVTQATQ
jgi:hypothetical protein